MDTPEVAVDKTKKD